MKKCPLRRQWATEPNTLAKRGISDVETGGFEHAQLEPPHKVVRLLPVSPQHKNTVLLVG